ncbi:MAG: D-alanyl-D-alanine carboxypeptidase/D-alanyl-D-alanine-endopeptidase [Zoogloeaceae bacterium]|nr:D-alanyl-D-alanine carboxypeptidase/D-alanyl-D-alanine-endopeptidase [Zoogloeaceae bacterium]
MRVSALILTFSLTLSLGVGAAETLPEPVRAALARSGLPEDAVAIWIQPVEASRPSWRYRAEEAMNPASVMKLVTAWAALDSLGPAFTWSTRIAGSSAPGATGRLEGNLYLIGGGDPLLTYDRLSRLLRQVRGLGISEITGDLVLDDSLFTLPPHDPNAFDGRGDRPYNAGPSALVLNFNAIRLTLLTRPGHPRPWIASDPPLSRIPLVNEVRQEPGPCGEWDDELTASIEPGAAGQDRLTVRGRWRTECQRKDWHLAPLPATRFSPALVGALWEELGGRLTGRVRFGKTPTNTFPLFEEKSPPLAEVIREMNKWSNNVIARQIFLTLGLQVAAPGEPLADAARRNVSISLGKAGIDATDLVMENGAGLSRIARIRAATVGEVLIAAWRRPFMPEFMAALPIAGVDGTARRRLKGDPAAGYAHVKTGSLDGVVTVAGYVLDRFGRRYAAVMLTQHPNASASRPAQDALLSWIWNGGAQP